MTMLPLVQEVKDSTRPTTLSRLFNEVFRLQLKVDGKDNFSLFAVRPIRTALHDSKLKLFKSIFRAGKPSAANVTFGVPF